jgi:hypothetical protein
MNIKQQKRIANLTRVLAAQGESVTFKVNEDNGTLFLWADNAEGRWFEKVRRFHAVIGVKGGVRVLHKHNFTI